MLNRIPLCSILVGGIQIKCYFIILILAFAVGSMISVAEYNSSSKNGVGYSGGQSDYPPRYRC